MLIFVAMGVIWLFSGIAKARANKIKDSDFPEEEPEPEPVGRGLKPIQTEPERPEQRHPRAESKPLLTTLRQQLYSADYPLEEVEEIKKPEMPAIKPIVRAPAVVKVDELSQAAKKDRTIKSKRFLELDSTDELKKAILYCEILGKPVSLRDSAF